MRAIISASLVGARGGHFFRALNNTSCCKFSSVSSHRPSVAVAFAVAAANRSRHLLICAQVAAWPNGGSWRRTKKNKVNKEARCSLVLFICGAATKERKKKKSVTHIKQKIATSTVFSRPPVDVRGTKVSAHLREKKV